MDAGGRAYQEAVLIDREAGRRRLRVRRSWRRGLERDLDSARLGHGHDELDVVP